jgi:hypothetical protein
MGEPLGRGDRVLVLGLAQCSSARLRKWAATLTEGFLVGVGEDGAVRRARRELADLDNVIFSAGGREDIPWKEDFFTLIVDAEGGAETAEMRRVMRAGGRIYSIQP